MHPEKPETPLWLRVPPNLQPLLRSGDVLAQTLAQMHDGLAWFAAPPLAAQRPSATPQNMRNEMNQYQADIGDEKASSNRWGDHMKGGAGSQELQALQSSSDKAQKTGKGASARSKESLEVEQVRYS